jgi:hypothetical protein
LYSLEDLAAAEAELMRWDDAYANDRSNNPNKFEAQRRDARRAVRTISDELKRLGLLEKSSAESLSDELDGLYPNAKPKTIIAHNGIKYQIRYFPVEKSRSRKSVTEWGHEWVRI